MAIQHLTDESILQLYENIRQQVEADRRLGAEFRLLGDTAKEQAQRLRDEIDRRGLRVAPIIW